MLLGRDRRALVGVGERSWRAPLDVTIHEVARRAGVSITTVSHVLNGRGRVAPETRIRVRRAAEELDYRANAHAQQLVTRKSRTIAVQIANSVDSNRSAVVPNSEYFLEVLNGATEAASERSYATILVPLDATMERIGDFAVDGVLIVDPRGDESIFTSGWSEARPLITTGRPVAEPREVAVSVDNDLVAAAHLALDHLEERGYREIAFITTDTARSYTADMVSGVRSWVEARGREPVVEEIPEPATLEGAALATERLFERARIPDAIFTSSENLALGVLHAAQQRGLSVPDELGICSAVDSSILQLTVPSITGIFVNPREVGRRAAAALIDLVEGMKSSPRFIEVPVELNVRASSQRGDGLRVPTQTAWSNPA